MKPRRQQATISFQSDRAKARLALLTANGRSQAEVIEEAIDRMPIPKDEDEADRLRWLAELRALIFAIPKGEGLSMKEFDALEYDENGDLR